MSAQPSPSPAADGPDPESEGFRRWVFVAEVAAHLGKIPPSIRRHIARGYYAAYRLPGERAALLDLDEVDAEQERLRNEGRVRGKYATYGGKARIIHLPSRGSARPDDANNGR